MSSDDFGQASTLLERAIHVAYLANGSRPMLKKALDFGSLYLAYSAHES
jgi:hypothetical protein